MILIYVNAWSTLYDLEEGLGAEPRKQQTEFIFAPSLAIFMGTGDGTMINEFIEAKRPYNICIALRCWDDLRSSFKNIDWINLWNNYCQQENRSISFILYKSISDFRDQLFVVILRYLNILQFWCLAPSQIVII